MYFELFVIQLGPLTKIFLIKLPFSSTIKAIDKDYKANFFQENSI